MTFPAARRWVGPEEPFPEFHEQLGSAGTGRFNRQRCPTRRQLPPGVRSQRWGQGEGRAAGEGGTCHFQNLWVKSIFHLAGKKCAGATAAPGWSPNPMAHCPFRSAPPFFSPMCAAFVCTAAVSWDNARVAKWRTVQEPPQTASRSIAVLGTVPGLARSTIHSCSLPIPCAVPGTTIDEYSPQIPVFGHAQTQCKQTLPCVLDCRI